MKIIKKDIWRYWKDGWNIVIPTNGWVNSNGLAASGRGLAYQANHLIKNFMKSLGNLLVKHENHVFFFPNNNLITFPTKHYWKDNADLELIKQSCKELRQMMQTHEKMRVAMPKVGCGTGYLEWKQVAPVIKKYFNDLPEERFIIVDNEQGDYKYWGGDDGSKKRGKKSSILKPW